MSRYKRLLKCVDEMRSEINILRHCQIAPPVIDGLSKRLRHLECGGHEWLFTCTSHNIFFAVTSYCFTCDDCGKRTTRIEAALTGTMRPQLEALKYLKPKKKTKQRRKANGTT